MIKIKLIIWVLTLIISLDSQSQTDKKMSNNSTTNPLLCDPINRVCEMLGEGERESEERIVLENKPIKITYFTDPICSSCWGIEPQLRKLKLEYGNYIEIDYRMGGLLPDWSYNSGGISKPSDIAHHWEDAGLYYQMPIAGDVWIKDPLDSSFPPSIAFKAAQKQDKSKAIVFMRKLREMLFIEKKNITRWDTISKAAVYAGLDTFKLKDDFEGDAKKTFEADLVYSRQLGVRGFPTLFFSDDKGNQITLYGSKSYEEFENAIRRIVPDATKKTIDVSSPLSLFSYYPTLAPKEYALLADISLQEATGILDRLVSENKLEKQTIKTGSIYKTK